MSTDPRPEIPAPPTPLEHTPSVPSTFATLMAEAMGTFLLVIAVVSAAVLAADFGTGANGSSLGIGFVGVALAIGIAVVAGVYAFGPISGGHFNPAITIGLAAAGRFPWAQVLPYIIAQIVGGLIASTIVYFVAMFGPEGFLAGAQESGFASNGYGDLSPGGFGLVAVAIVEVVFTAIFVWVILGVTHTTRGNNFAGLAIGLTLVLIHLATIPVSNTSVNPARSLAAAVYGGPEYLAQIWAFFVFPIIGGLLAGFTFRPMFDGLKRR